MKNKKLATYIYITILLVSTAYASTFTDSSQGDFNNGTYYQTFYNLSGFVQLNATHYNGTFISQVFDAGANSSWNNISWTQGGYYQQELLGNQQVESGLGGADMTGNVLLMHMNNNWNDVSGNSNNGIPQKGATFTSNSKLGNHAGDFDGDNDYVNVSLGSIGAPFTAEAWCYFNPSSDYDYCLMIGEGNNMISFSKDQADNRFYSYSENSQKFGPVLQMGQWIHIVGVYITSPPYHRLFINGKEVSVDNFTSAMNTNGELVLGEYHPSHSHQINGSIDEVAVYNRTLSAEEVLDHYKRGVLRLNLTVRSCDDGNCSGENWGDINDSSPQDLLVVDNQYFQYKTEFGMDNVTYSPELYNVTVSYTATAAGENDTTSPIVSLVSPAEGQSFTSTNNVTFNIAASDNIDLDNCTLWTNISGIWQANETKIFSGVSDSDTWDFYNLDNGSYVWDAYCCDNSSNCAWNASNFTFSVAYSPSNGAGAQDYNITYLFDGSSTTDYGYLNGILNNTFYNDSIYAMQLNATHNNGSYTSQVFDVGSNSQWNNISWTQGGYYQQELPGNQQVESGLGGADMTGNVLLMHMNEASGTIVDYSGEGNNGTYNGANYSVEGKLGTALSFDGTDDYVNTSLTDDLSGSGAFSVLTWVKDIPTGNNYVISQAHQLTPSYASDWILGYSNGGLWFRSTQINGGDIISDGNWHYLGFTFEGTTAKLYINGGYIGSSTPAGFGGVGSVKLMTRGDAASSFTSGSMDELAIYNRSLSAEEVLDHYKRGVLRLNLTARSCDDANCDTETWTDVNDTSPQDLSVADNQYFQYKFNFETDNTSYSPKLYNVTINYEPPVPPVDYNFTYLFNGADTAYYSYLNGTLNNTFYNDTAYAIELDATHVIGSYASQVFDVNKNAVWNNISWSGTATGELPDNQSIENSLGGANMTGNVLLYHMNEASGTIVDYSGEGNNGTAYGGVTYGASGKLNTALSLDGTNDYVDAGDDANLDIVDEITIEAWVYPILGTGYIISKNIDSAANNQYAIYWDGGNVVYYPSANPTSVVGSVPTGVWTHVIFTRTGTTGQFYINGIASGSSATCTMPTNNQSVNIGRRKPNNFYFEGTIDEIAIWNRTLSADEILDHYKRGILRLNLTVKSCNDFLCSGENWININDNSPQELNIIDNQYFQYKFNFETDNTSYSPKLYNVTINYEYDSVPPDITVIRPVDYSSHYTDWVEANVSLNEPGNCSFSLDSSPYSDMSQISSTSSYKNMTNLTEGLHNVTFNCSDLSNNSNTSLRHFTVSFNPGCTNGLKDQDESDIDCGGICGNNCNDTKMCNSNLDCLNNVCESGVCVSCFDSVKNQGEGDIDCGGVCGSNCNDSKTCNFDLDCSSGFCENNTCVSCSDGIKNNNETDIDCGGPNCVGCAIGKNCTQVSDCDGATSCSNGICCSCSDGIQNQGEDLVDCGGPYCNACPYLLYLYDDCGNPSNETHLIQGKDFTFVGNVNSSLSEAEKSVSYHNDRVIYRFPVDNMYDYKVKVKLLQQSNGKRAENILADSIVLDSSRSVPKYNPVQYTYDIPLPSYRNDSSFDLIFEKVSGPNAVCSEIELWKSTSISSSLLESSYIFDFENPMNYSYNSSEIIVENSSARICVSIETGNWNTQNKTDFDDGTYNETFYNETSSALELNLNHNNGTYYSKILDTVGESEWYNISWIQASQYGYELPNNKDVETQWVSGNANMTGNVLLLHMNEVSGTIVDYSGEGNNATQSGDVAYGANGKLNSALNFDGNNDLVSVSENTPLNFTEHFSYGAWFKADSIPTYAGIMTREHTWGSGYNLNIRNAGIYCGWGIYTGAFGAPSTNTWYYAVCVYENGTMKLYVNGVFSDQDTGTMGVGNQNLKVGSFYSGGSLKFNGTIDEVFVFNRTLSADEILGIYKRGALRLNLSVRSCDYANCDTGTWADINKTSPQDLSIADNRYFQYKADFESYNQDYSPQLNNLSVAYSTNKSAGNSSIETSDLVVPDLTKWVDVTFIDSGNLTYDYSTDSGNSWIDVPLNGSLSNASVANGKIRFRADLADNAILYDINITYYSEDSGEFIITNLQNGRHAVLSTNTSVDVTSVPQTGTQDVLIGLGSFPSNGEFMALLTINFTSNVGFENITFFKSDSKSALDNATFPSQIVSKGLVIRMLNSVGEVYICPHAHTIEETNPTCINKTTIGMGQTKRGMSVSEITRKNKKYYLVSNVSGTGGGEGSAPTLSNADVTPNLGNTSTMFFYNATYTDAENDAASFVYVSIDGTNYTMIETDSADTNVIDGKLYNYSTILNEGLHTFKFYAADEANVTTNTSLYEGPNVTGVSDDADGDGTPDMNDTLEGDEDDVIKSGVSSLNITIGGNSTNGTFSGEQEVIFYDGSTALMNFSHDFSTAEIDLSKISIEVTSLSIVVNLSGQLLTNEKKALFLDDNSFISLCVKDAEITSVSDISSGCNGANETDFTSCLGNSLGITINNITCYDQGTRIKIENVVYSGIKGTQLTQSQPPSGGGGYSCTSVWQCTVWSECYPNGTRTRTCTDIRNCRIQRNKPNEVETCTYILPEKPMKEIKEGIAENISEEIEEKEPPPTKRLIRSIKKLFTPLILIVLTSALFIIAAGAVAYHYAEDRTLAGILRQIRTFLQKEKDRIIKKKEPAEETTEKLTKKKPVKYIITDIDKLYSLIQKMKIVSIRDVATPLGVDEDLVLEWAKALEAKGLIKIKYPLFGSPILKKKRSRQRTGIAEESEKTKREVIRKLKDVHGSAKTKKGESFPVNKKL